MSSPISARAVAILPSGWQKPSLRRERSTPWTPIRTWLLWSRSAKKEAPSLIEPILAKPDDPVLPATGVDLVFTSNTYHHIDNHVTYFSNLRNYLRPGGKVVIIELDGRAWPEGLLGHY